MGGDAWPVGQAGLVIRIGLKDRDVVVAVCHRYLRHPVTNVGVQVDAVVFVQIRVVVGFDGRARIPVIVEFADLDVAVDVERLLRRGLRLVVLPGIQRCGDAADVDVPGRVLRPHVVLVQQRRARAGLLLVCRRKAEEGTGGGLECPDLLAGSALIHDGRRWMQIRARSGASGDRPRIGPGVQRVARGQLPPLDLAVRFTAGIRVAAVLPGQHASGGSSHLVQFGRVLNVLERIGGVQVGERDRL